MIAFNAVLLYCHSKEDNLKKYSKQESDSPYALTHLSDWLWF